MSTSKHIKNGFWNIIDVIRNEFITISTSYAILLVLMGGIFIYGFLYNIMYEPNLVRKAPVAVVDNSHSELSRKFIRYLNATSQVDVIATDVQFPEARDMMKLGQVIGILYMPSDFEDKVSRGEQSMYIMYENTTVFLAFLALQTAASNCMLAINEYYRPEMLVFLESPDAMDLTNAKAFDVSGVPMYNHTEGYGSYLIPAVLFVIIFQTLLMVIAMIIGEENRTREILRYAGNPVSLSFGRMAQAVIGKSFVYLVIYALFCVFMIGVIPPLFDLPDLGNHFDTVILFVPYILATSFFGISLSFLFSDGDAPIVMIAFFSVGLIFLSGVSYPLELQPWYWQICHFIFPAGVGTLGYVMINSMGSSMSEIRIEYTTLLIQCVVYFITACFVMRYNVQKAMLKSVPSGASLNAKTAVNSDNPTSATGSAEELSPGPTATVTTSTNQSSSNQ